MTKRLAPGILTCVVVVLASALTSCGPREPRVLRYDGLYRAGPVSGDGATYWHYLRLYEDGTVLGMSSTGRPSKVAEWFHKPYESGGSWAREDERITFSIEGASGAVDYEGEVLQDGLQLTHHSHINDHRGERRYEFVALEEDAAGPKGRGSALGRLTSRQRAYA